MVFKVWRCFLLSFLVFQDYQRLLSSAPSRRLNPSKLAESSVLKNKLVDTIAFLENLAVKDSTEKDMFFKRLPQSIPSFPTALAQVSRPACFACILC